MRNDNYTLNDIKKIISKIGTTINVGFRLYNANISFTDEAMNYIKNNHISLGAINVNQTTKFETSWAIFDGPMIIPDDAITHYSATVYRGINGNTGKGDPYNPQKSIYELAVTENFGGSTQRLTCGYCTSAKKNVVFPDEPGTQGVIYLVCGSDGKGNFMLIQNRKPKSPLKVLHSEFSGNVSNKLTLESNFSFNSDNFDNTYTTLIEYINKACELMSNDLEGIHLRCTIYIRGNAASKLTDVSLEYKNNGLCVICELIAYDNGLPYGVYTCLARRSANVKTGWFENNILY